MSSDNYDLLGRICIYDDEGTRQRALIVGASEDGLKIIVFGGNNILKELHSLDYVHSRNLLPIDMSTEIGRQFAEPLLEGLYFAILHKEKSSVKDDLPF